jgi:hypothetical protein
MIVDSTVSFDRRDQVMRCSACFESIHVSRAVLSNPDRFIDVLEDAQIDHADCKSYTEARAVVNARLPRAGLQVRYALKPRDGAKSHLNRSL